MGVDMRYETFHLSEQELLLAADGELSPRKMRKVRAHLDACWSCRARLREVEGAILDFVRIHQRTLNPKLPPAAGPRALFRARLAARAAVSRPGIWQRFLAAGSAIVHSIDESTPLTGDFRARIGISMACACLALALALFLLMMSNRMTPDRQPGLAEAVLDTTPDPQLTPGMTLPLTSRDLCLSANQQEAPALPRSVALKVFAAYGITNPGPRTYEVDYLITPELGGAADIRNLWPQPYRAVAWNAHAKDALEDHLYKLVCRGSLDLAVAQHDISTDWISAYKKYFRTQEPLSAHAGFLKDQPWE
jgi:hypothetical protein